MSGKVLQVARRIRELRKIAGLSVDTLAKEFKVSPEVYAKYESGTADIPVSLLYEVAQRFNVDLTALLTGGEPHLHMYSVVRKGKGLSIERRKEYKYQDLAFNFVGKKAETFLVTVAHRPAKSIHYYSHPGQEFNYVLDGTLTVFLDGAELVLNPGDSLIFDSGAKHAMAAQGKKPAKFLAMIF